MGNDKDGAEARESALNRARTTIAGAVLENRAPEDSRILPINKYLDSYLFLLMGATGSGKSVLIRGVQDVVGDMAFIEKDTTRPRREFDDYSRGLISPEEFAARKKAGQYFETYGTPFSEDHDVVGQSARYGIRKDDIVKSLDRKDALLTLTFPDSVEKVLARFDETDVRVIPVILTTSEPQMLEDRLHFRKCDPAEKKERLKQVADQWRDYQGMQAGIDHVIVNDSPEGLDQQMIVQGTMTDEVLKAIDTSVRKFRSIINFYQNARPMWPFGKNEHHYMFVDQVVTNLFGYDHNTLKRILRPEDGKEPKAYFHPKKVEEIKKQSDPMTIGNLFQNVYATSVRTESGVAVVRFNDHAYSRVDAIRRQVEKFMPGIAVHENGTSLRYALTDKQASNTAKPYALELRFKEPNQ